VPKVVLCIVREMVDFDVAAHPQQLVQVRVGFAGVHNDGIIRLNKLTIMGSKVRLFVVKNVNG